MTQASSAGAGASRVSEMAERIDALFLAELAVTALVVGAVLVLMVVFALRYRQGREVDRADPPRGRSARRAEIAWTLAPLAVFLGFFVWGTDIYLDLGSKAEDALEIKVTARQWSWRFEHPEGQAETDELHVPSGQTVRLSMVSEDVIHSLFIPALRVKQDVLPRRYTHLQFKAERPGTYPLFCAEYCGTGHASMRAKVVVLEPEAYRDWAEANVPAKGRESGEAIFRRLGCPDCHAPDAAVPAPSLAGLYGRRVELADGSTVEVDESYLRDSILLPSKQVVAGYDPIMPSFKDQVDETELMRLIDYIKGLKGQGDQP